MKSEKAVFALAKFKKDHLIECFHGEVAAVRLASEPEPPSDNILITLDQAALMVVDEAIVTANDGDSMLVSKKPDRDAGAKNLSRMLRALVSGKIVKDPKNQKWAEELRQIAWPYKKYAEPVKKGILAKVDGCTPQHVGRAPLGVCTLRDMTSDVEYPQVSWVVKRHHFDVGDTADSDAGLKACLKIGGKWEAPDKNDPAAAAARIRQRSTQLRSLLDQASGR